MTPHPPIPEPLWNTVPPEAQAAFLEVFGSLERRIAELQARLNLNSTNSSKPPPPILLPSSSSGDRRPRLPGASAGDSPVTSDTPERWSHPNNFERPSRSSRRSAEAVAPHCRG